LKRCEAFFALGFDFPSTFNLGSELRDQTQSLEILPGVGYIHESAVSEDSTAAKPLPEILAKDRLVVGPCIHQCDKPVRRPIIDDLIENNPTTTVELTHLQAGVIGGNESKDLAVESIPSGTG
jgi:hypothetical protein